MDCKSTSGGCHLLGRSLVSWSSKKQNSVAFSTAEAEYIAAGACCAQILYMKQTLLDFGVKLDMIPLLCDNESAVKIAKNPVQHSRTKHIDIRITSCVITKLKETYLFKVGDPRSNWRIFSQNL